MRVRGAYPRGEEKSIRGGVGVEGGWRLSEGELRLSVARGRAWCRAGVGDARRLTEESMCPPARGGGAQCPSVVEETLCLAEDALCGVGPELVFEKLGVWQKTMCPSVEGGGTWRHLEKGTRCQINVVVGHARRLVEDVMCLSVEVGGVRRRSEGGWSKGRLVGRSSGGLRHGLRAG